MNSSNSYIPIPTTEPDSSSSQGIVPPNKSLLNNRRLLLIPIVSFILFILSFFGYLRKNMIDGSEDLSILSSSGSLPLSPFTLIYDNSSKSYKVIDNFPILMSKDKSKEKIILAEGNYYKNYNNNGWNFLNITSFPINNIEQNYNYAKSTDSNYAHNNSNRNSTTLPPNVSEKSLLLIEQYIRSMKALGFLEGHVTCHEMNQWYVNFYSGLFDGGDPTNEALEFLEENFDWMLENSDKYYLVSDYWLAIRGILAQVEGMVAGAKDGCPGTEQKTSERLWTIRNDDVFLNSLHKKPSLIHLLLLNANGDLYQIAEKFDQINQPPSEVLDGQFDDDDFDLSSINYKRNLNDIKSFVFETTLGNITNDIGKQWNRNLFKQLKLARESNDILLKSSNIESKIEEEFEKFSDKDKHSFKFSRTGKFLNNKKINQYLDEDTQLNNKEIKNSFRQNRLARNLRHDHCSALIKLLPNNSDILFGHNTWDDFQVSSPRIIKSYTHGLISNNEAVEKSFNVIFSSSPGLISSIDDFFIVKGHGHLSVIETSLDIYNPQLLYIIQPQSMLSWVRARVSNQLANSSKSWAKIFSQYHSGTYVNQWMVMDMKKFKKGNPPEPNFLTVLEEVPGYVHIEDMTQHLINETYWASYNNPFFDDISRLTGQYDKCLEDKINCFDSDPRGLIFKQYHNNVHNISDLQLLLGSNKFQDEKFSFNDSCNAISCRNDLQIDPKKRYPFGAIDGKVSSINIAKENSSLYARLGPSQDDQPMFCWNGLSNFVNHRNKPLYHAGHPSCFNYTWQPFHS